MKKRLGKKYKTQVEKLDFHFTLFQLIIFFILLPSLISFFCLSFSFLFFYFLSLTSLIFFCPLILSFLVFHFPFFPPHRYTLIPLCAELIYSHLCIELLSRLRTRDQPHVRTTPSHRNPDLKREKQNKENETERAG